MPNLHIAKSSDSFSENQMSMNLRYIERNPSIKISQNIADTIWISETYLNFSSGVKPHVRNMGLCKNKKGKSIGLDSPFKVVIKIEYHRNFESLKVPICWRYHKFSNSKEAFASYHFDCIFL